MKEIVKKVSDYECDFASLSVEVQYLCKFIIEMSFRTFSEARKDKGNSKSRDNKFHSEVRHRQSDDSRSRSRDDAKSKNSAMSQRSNRSGPVVFGGNTVIRKSDKVEDQTSEILSKAEFRRPLAKIKNIRDIDLDD